MGKMSFCESLAHQRGSPQIFAIFSKVSLILRWSRSKNMTETICQSTDLVPFRDGNKSELCQQNKIVVYPLALSVISHH